MRIVQGAVYLSEPAVQGESSGVLKLVAQILDLLFSTTAAAELFTADPADREAETERKQHPQQDVSSSFCHADFSRVVGACSRSTRWMVARETL